LIESLTPPFMSEPTSKVSLMSPAAKTIFVATLAAGTLDILSALILYRYVYNIGARQLLQGIASALLGNKAFKGGGGTAFLGLCIHYCIALSFAAFYFFVFPYVPFLKKYKIAGGVLYGVFAWVVMNLAVLPLIGYSKYNFHWVPVIRSAVILMYAIGIPIALIVNRHYSKYKSPSPLPQSTPLF
jgi:hypothetical protein